jgi:hypothetical protein
LQANAAFPSRDLFKYLNYQAISIDVTAAIFVPRGGVNPEWFSGDDWSGLSAAVAWENLPAPG